MLEKTPTVAQRRAQIVVERSLYDLIDDELESDANDNDDDRAVLASGASVARNDDDDF